MHQSTLPCDFALPAEWEPQSAIMLTWPHAGTDWKPYSMRCIYKVLFIRVHPGAEKVNTWGKIPNHSRSGCSAERFRADL